ncbi:MAG: thiol-disulfide oxidoreductase DCC family protein [Planctomycetota bacterium]
MPGQVIQRLRWRVDPRLAETITTRFFRSTLLPSPAERPRADIVIYDGECQFCCRQVARLDWLDRGGRLAFLSLHDPAVAALLPGMSHEELMKEMLVLPAAAANRQPRPVHGGAAAARYLSRRLPLLWWLAPLLHLPGSLPLWSWAYHLVARNRYRWNKARGKADCATGSCDLHFQAPKPRS